MLCVGVIARFVLYFRSRRGSQTPESSAPHTPRPSEDSLAHLGTSISESEELTSLMVPSQADPVVHLRGTTKLAPVSYRDAIQDIHRSMQSNQVAVVDLSVADNPTAIRIVDFCTGAMLASRGYAYKISNSSMILIPCSNYQ
ncbi:cell division protein SepF [Saccharomonospora saliphila]|uniref:cell division protein SepF n=1 Tax=Saccharomonospora saliphila TaxID=369829 RepID=UPI0038CDB974